MRQFRRYFLTGLVVVLPTVVSFYVIIVFGNWLDGLLGGMFRGESLREGGIPGLGVVSLVLMILLIGLITSKTVGRRIVEAWDQLLARIPILNRIYRGAKQVAEAVFQSESRVFRQVVLIPYPHPGIYAIAFQTERAGAEIQRRTSKDLVGVFLPTTPNPTSGFFLLVPSSEVITLDMDVEDGLKLVVSAGSVMPDPTPHAPAVALSPPLDPGVTVTVDDDIEIEDEPADDEAVS
jgi:uncharacterized membrane protein